ncbi:uncharacterized protein LOC116209086 [Punica granatum]|uniref:Uncharacterized protein n=2 Tax=Punica granatum TaxID=22663 RepID=A0A2I0KTX6_PUNGR|nr:uncharacterized protein LOC116209086 [Punica granatum]PKI71793.1 hypothetical protein CRG98_007809 [Punica granatum]
MEEDGNGEEGEKEAVDYREALLGKGRVRRVAPRLPKYRKGQATMKVDDIAMVDFSNQLCPIILVTKAELEQFRANWRSSLIVKVLGRRVSYWVLKNRLQRLWQPKGELTLTDLPNDFFIVKTHEDRDFALYRGPWTVLGHYLTVREWVPDFLPLEAKIDRVAMWVRIPNLPMEYQNEILLRRTGYALGRPIRIGQNTVNLARVNFVRACVEVNLEEPLRPSVELLGAVYRVEYKGVNLICFKCGRVGHQREGCADEQSASSEANAREENKEAGVTHGGDSLVSKHADQDAVQGYPVMEKGKETAGPPTSKDGSIEFGSRMIVQGRTSKSRNVQKYKGPGFGKEVPNMKLHGWEGSRRGG